jgi:hypothetical protein
MRDIYIRRSWLRFATGFIALAIIAAIWINYRLELSRQAPPPGTRRLKARQACSRLVMIPPNRRSGHEGRGAVAGLASVGYGKREGLLLSSSGPRRARSGQCRRAAVRDHVLDALKPFRARCSTNSITIGTELPVLRRHAFMAGRRCVVLLQARQAWARWQAQRQHAGTRSTAGLRPDRPHG